MKRMEKTKSQREGACIFVNKTLINLGVGTGFGELALMSNQPRMSTIKTTTASTFATLSKGEFATLIKKAIKRKQTRDGDFLRNFEFFQRLTSVKIQKILNVLERHSFQKGKTLFREGESVNGVWLIEQGEVTYEKVTQEPDMGYPGTKWMQPRLFKGDHFTKAKTFHLLSFSAVDMVG